MSQDQMQGLQGGRLFVLVWIGVYPFVTLVNWLIGGMLQTLPLALRTLILSGLIVSYMIFFWIPLLRRFSSRLKGLQFGWRFVVLAWIGVYPFATLISWLFGGMLLTLPLALRTLILSGLIVSFMTFFWIPLLRRFISRFQSVGAQGRSEAKPTPSQAKRG